MSEIIVGTKLKSVKSGMTATVTEINKKYKTALVDLSDGTNHSYSLATLKDKRAWKIVDDDSEYVAEVMEQKEDLGLECPNIDPKKVEVITSTSIVIPTPDVNAVDQELIGKFVKKAQKLITILYRDNSGYHVTINYDGKTKSYVDKNLQNIRSAIGHIYRGEEA